MTMIWDMGMVTKPNPHSWKWALDLRGWWTNGKLAFSKLFNWDKPKGLH